MNSRPGIAPVVSTIILSATLLIIGGAIWSYTNSASQVLASDYVNETNRLIYEISERFTIEHVSNNTDCSQLNITLYNYGSVNVTLDVYASIDGTTYSSNPSNPTKIAEGERGFVLITIEAEKGDSVGIKAHSRRQNDAYYTYIVN